MKRFVFILIIVICLYFIINTFQLGMRIYQGMKISEQSSAFEIKPPEALRKILVVGDSTGVGTGATDPADSIAGRISRDYSHVEIINISEDGAKASDVLDQLKSVDENDFDLVLVQTGGNDILRFTLLDSLKNTISDVLHAARRVAPDVIFISTGNVGNAPAFFPPINWIYTKRTQKVRSVFMLVSREKGIEYVDLFQDKGKDPFVQDPDRFFTSDLLHPSSQGYAMWYEELKAQTSLPAILSFQEQ